MRALAICLLVAGCSDSPSTNAMDLGPGSDATTAPDLTTTTAADWVLRFDPGNPAAAIPTALLGHYDLSGALFHYDKVSGLPALMATAGMRDWRVGVGRWEFQTRNLPRLTDMTDCTAKLAGLPPESYAPAGSTELSLLDERDWFIDDGKPVTDAMTQDDKRYRLDYLRSVIDTSRAFGAEPYVNIDHMPRALSVNRTLSRTDCTLSWGNGVSNARPADADVFADAVVGMVKRVVEGSGTATARPVKYWEIWNEPELPYAWDPRFEPDANDKLGQFFQMAIKTIGRLDAYRKASGQPLRLGLGSFAFASTAAKVIQAFDAAGIVIPIDFVSFHSYDNDPLAIVAAITTVAAARSASQHYKNVELSLAEWTTDLRSSPDPQLMDQSLVVATVLSLGAAAGLDRAYHTIFYDFYEGIAWGIVDHSGNAEPLHHTYDLLARLLGDGASRLPPSGLENGFLDGGMGAVLAAKDKASGAVRVLLVNRQAASRTARIDVAGVTATPRTIRVFSNPLQPPTVTTPTGPQLVVPARSIVLVEL